MPSRREAIALELELLDIRDEFIASKATKAEDPERYIAAKKAIGEARIFWKSLHEQLGAEAAAAAVVKKGKG